MHLIDGHIRVRGLKETSTLADLETELSRLPADDVRRAIGFAFRTSPQFIQQAGDATKTELRTSALRRVPEKPVYLVCFDQASSEMQLWRLSESGVLQENVDLLSQIREADLLTTLRAAGASAFLRASHSYHFISPSLKHTNVFLRVGNIICSRESLDTLAFWCCPLIEKAQAVIVDTWSISSIPLRAMQLLGKQILLDCLPAHPTADRDSAKSVLASTLQTLDWEAGVLFLFSAIGYGDGVHTTQMLLKELGCNDLHAEWAALYGYVNSPPTARIFCRLQENYQAFASPSTCSWCRERSHAVPVNPRFYHVATGNENLLTIDPSLFDNGRSFIANYSNIHGALRLHRDDPNDGRHHAFYIDVVTLLQDKNFRQKFLAALDECSPKPDIVATPDHIPGRALGKLAAEQFGIPLVVHNDLRRARLDSESIKRLNDVEHMLIVDDVLKTGSRLEAFTQSLREDYSPFQSITYLIAIARPRSEDDLARVQRALTTRNRSWTASLRYVEKLLLPAWDARECPWCKEYDALGRVGETLPRLPDWLRDRMARLAELERGLLDHPFLQAPNQESPPLANESTIGQAGLSPIGTVFSFASALQLLRTAKDETRRLQPDFPLCKSLAPRVLINYSEALLRQCILRLVHPSEWPVTAQTEPLDILDTFLHNDPFVLGEFLLAMSRRAFMPNSDERIINLWRGTYLLAPQELNLLLGVAPPKS